MLFLADVLQRKLILDDVIPVFYKYHSDSRRPSVIQPLFCHKQQVSGSSQTINKVEQFILFTN